MTEREPEHDEGTEGDDQSADEFVKEIEDDPSTAGHSDEPADELRGG